MLLGSLRCSRCWSAELLHWVSSGLLEFIDNHAGSGSLYAKPTGSFSNDVVFLCDQFHKFLTLLTKSEGTLMEI